MQKKRCRDCGGEIIVSRTRNNRELPLDPRVVVYKIGEGGDAYPLPKEQFMISHFIVCKGGIKEENPGGTD